VQVGPGSAATGAGTLGAAPAPGSPDVSASSSSHGPTPTSIIVALSVVCAAVVLAAALAAFQWVQSRRRRGAMGQAAGATGQVSHWDTAGRASVHRQVDLTPERLQQQCGLRDRAKFMQVPNRLGRGCSSGFLLAQSIPHCLLCHPLVISNQQQNPCCLPPALP
jgi:hypothetical protein